MRHDAIVVTSWHEGAITEAAVVARRLGLEVLGPSAEATNRYRTILVCPDGGKEGWEESDAFNAKRAQFVAILDGFRYEDGSTNLEWVALSYGNDDADASIDAHAWQSSPAGEQQT